MLLKCAVVQFQHAAGDRAGNHGHHGAFRPLGIRPGREGSGVPGDVRATSTRPDGSPCRSRFLDRADILLAPHQTGGTDSRSPHGMKPIDVELWRRRDADPAALLAEFQGEKGRGSVMLPEWRPPSLRVCVCRGPVSLQRRPRLALKPKDFNGPSPNIEGCEITLSQNCLRRQSVAHWASFVECTWANADERQGTGTARVGNRQAFLLLLPRHFSTPLSGATVERGPRGQAPSRFANGAD